MAPPPRPPIICYDLQTNSNARRVPDARYRVPLTGTGRKPKVTVVHRDANELKNARADACWHLQNSYNNVDGRYEHHDENFENLPSHHRPTTTTTTRPIERVKASPHNPHDRIVRINRPQYNKNLLESRPYKFNAQPFSTSSTTNNQSSMMSSKLNVANARHAYGQKLRHEAEEKVRRLERGRQRLAMQAQLDEISAQLESSKRVHENLLKTFGMSHNAARYIQHQDEAFAKLKEKVDRIAQTRSKELSQRVQEKGRLQEMQRREDRRIEEKRLGINHPRTPLSTHCKHRWNSTLNNSLSSNSPTTNTATTTNTASPSSTISISSCSSPMSIDEQHIPSIHYADPPTYKSTASNIRTTPPTSSLLSSSPSKNPRDCKRTADMPTPVRPKDHFSFYKGDPLERNETIEVTDVDFFDKVEDKTMLEVNELLNKMQSVLRDFGQELQ